MNWPTLDYARRNIRALTPPRFENRDELLGEQRISIGGHVSSRCEENHQLDPSNSEPPGFIQRFAWVNGNPGDLDAATLDLDDEDHVPNRPNAAHLTLKKSQRRAWGPNGSS